MIKVDQEKCVGCRTCVDMCPEVFALLPGKKAKAIVINPEGCKICDCQKVVESCPVNAIFWTEGEDEKLRL